MSALEDRPAINCVAARPSEKGLCPAREQRRRMKDERKWTGNGIIIDKESFRNAVGRADRKTIEPNGKIAWDESKSESEILPAEKGADR